MASISIRIWSCTIIARGNGSDKSWPGNKLGCTIWGFAIRSNDNARGTEVSGTLAFIPFASCFGCVPELLVDVVDVFGVVDAGALLVDVVGADVDAELAEGTVSLCVVVCVCVWGVGAGAAGACVCVDVATGLVGFTGLTGLTGDVTFVGFVTDFTQVLLDVVHEPHSGLP